MKNKEKCFEVDEEWFQGLAGDLAFNRLKSAYGCENVIKSDDNPIVTFYDEGKMHIVVPYALAFGEYFTREIIECEAIRELVDVFKDKALVIIMPVYINMRKRGDKYFINDLNDLQFDFGQAIQIIENPNKNDTIGEIC